MTRLSGAQWRQPACSISRPCSLVSVSRVDARFVVSFSMVVTFEGCFEFMEIVWVYVYSF